MFIREKEVTLSDYRVNFLFSFVFAAILPILLYSDFTFEVLFSIIYFPITVIHELGHFIIAIIFFPDHNPQIKLFTLEKGLECGCVTLGGLEISWEAILLFMSGTFLVILTMSLAILILNRKNEKVGSYFQKYALFGLLCDIPNLFPTYPVEGAITDGFRSWLFLHDLMNLPYPTPQFSLLLTAIASVLIFYSSFYLGSFLFQTIIISLDKLQKYQPNPSIS